MSTLSELGRAALAATAGDAAGAAELRGVTPRPLSRAAVAGIKAAALLRPDHPDAALLRLGRAWSLSDAELVLTALLCDVELDVTAGRAVARVQAPIGGSRPVVALAATLLSPLVDGDPVVAVWRGAALARGLWVAGEAQAPLVERPLRLADGLALALRGVSIPPPGVSAMPAPGAALPPSWLAAAGRVARGLSDDTALVLRLADPRDAEALVYAVAVARGQRPWRVLGDAGAGVGAWLSLIDGLPCYAPAPGAPQAITAPAGFVGPIAVLAPPDGLVAVDGRAAWTLRPGPPAPAERRAAWRLHLPEAHPLADRLGDDLLLGPHAIAGLAAHARREAAGDGVDHPDGRHVAAAVRAAEGTPLHQLATAVDVGDTPTLVLPPAARADLAALRARCRARDALTDALGPAARQRGAPGVRALLHGPPGTGKTLAASWLAAELGLPLFRVDLASVLSKYIGETEKNLAALLTAAEAAEVVLLFDEADALFGKRTEVRSSNDRFANTQTNYLLQRLEAWSGVAVLTTNHRAGLDEAFTRRLDAVIELTLPTPAERRALWDTHLGDQHAVASADLNRLAATVPLAGGHIRNAVLAAAVLAREAGRPIQASDLVDGLEAELRKLGRQLPSGAR